MQVLQVRLYSLKPLDSALRQTFELPVWPYFNGVDKPPPAEFIKYLRDLSIVRYQDDYEKHPLAILIDQPGFEFRNMKPTRMYLTSGILDDDYKIIRWPGGRRELREAVISKTGDDFAWYDWNSPVEVLAMTDLRVDMVPQNQVPLSKGVRPLKVQ